MKKSANKKGMKIIFIFYLTLLFFTPYCYGQVIATYQFYNLNSLPTTISDSEGDSTQPTISSASASNDPTIDVRGIMITASKYLIISGTFVNSEYISAQMWVYKISGDLGDIISFGYSQAENAYLQGSSVLVVGATTSQFYVKLQIDTEQSITIEDGWNLVGFGACACLGMWCSNSATTVDAHTGTVWNTYTELLNTTDTYIGCKSCSDSTVEYIIHSLRVFNVHDYSSDPVINTYRYCGNGILNQYEECDDSNNESEDGCSPGCIIEDEYICMSSSSTSPSTCKKCQVENCLTCETADYDMCIKCQDQYTVEDGECNPIYDFVVSEGAQAMSSGTSAVSGISALAVIGVAILNLSSITAIWSLVNQFQLFLLLILTRTPMAGDAKGMLTGNAFASFDFSFIPIKSGLQSTPGMNIFFKWIEIDQDNFYLKTIGIESASAIINNIGVITSLCILFGMNFVFQCFISKKINFEKTKKCSINTIFVKFYDFFNFMVYIRLMLEGYQLVLVTCVSELVEFNFKEVANIVSVLISLPMLALCILCLYGSWHIYNSTRVWYDEDKKYKFDEYIAGIKKSSTLRLYPLIALIRRTIFVVWLIAFYWVGSVPLCIGMIFVQIVYIVIILFMRPFDRPENNMVEATNEFFYLTLIIMCIWLSESSKWNSINTQIFNGVVFGNSIAITCIMMGTFIITTCKNCYKNYFAWPQDHGKPTETEIKEVWKEANNKSKYTVEETMIRVDLVDPIQHHTKANRIQEFIEPKEVEETKNEYQF